MAEAGERVWWGNNLEDDLEEEGGGGEGRGGVAAAEPLAVARLAGAAHAQEGLRPAATGAHWGPAARAELAPPGSHARRGTVRVPDSPRAAGGLSSGSGG